MTRRTLRALQERARFLGFVVTHIDGEYALYPKGQKWNAYYTNDLDDAYGTLALRFEEWEKPEGIGDSI